MSAGLHGDDDPLAPAERLPSDYPVDWEFDVLLSDGEAAHIRPVHPGDAGRLPAFHHALSPESVHSRYFGLHPDLSPAEIDHLTRVDYRRRMAFVALRGEVIIGIARYDEAGTADTAELAFLVADQFQRRGVATLLLESLADYARQQGFTGFVAEVLPSNSPMLGVFEESGLRIEESSNNGVVTVALAAAPSPQYLARCDERERAASAASMTSLLRPNSVAVVGAGRGVGGVGHAIVRSLLAADFSGTVYPVNPNARSICGVPAFANLTACPEVIDLALVAVPASEVLSVVRDAAAAGTRSLVIISSGFAEVGTDGGALQEEILALARRHGIRVVGPNCLGVSNTAEEVRLDATFAPGSPPRGPVALLSQSGAVGIILLEACREAGLGLSSFVSVGNKIDVSGNDLLCYWEGDAATKVIALYLESFGNPRKFGRIARRVGKKKPIVMLKAGKSAAGARGARSHTAAAATPALAVGALSESAGVIEVDRLEELLDVVGVLAGAPLPGGRRVGLVGNSGGPLILAADGCEEALLEVPLLSSATQSALLGVLPPASARANPVDITADGDSAVFEQALRLALGDENVDAVIVAVTSLAALSANEARAVLDRVVADSEKPVIACLFGGAPSPEATPPGPSRFGVAASPERAAATLAKICTYASWRARPEETPPELGRIDAEAGRALLAGELSAHPSGGWLDAETGRRLLESYGIPVVATVTVDSLEGAIEAAGGLGYPVVLKAGSPVLVHKSDVGGVALGIKGPEELREQFLTMRANLGEAMSSAVLQPMLDSGVETIVGLTDDLDFGPLLMFGIGGVTTDLLGDHSFAVPPLSRGDADRLMSSIRGAPLLAGYRGSQTVDREALGEVVLRVARLGEDLPEVVELDLNPVVATSKGATVVDFKVRVAPAPFGPGPFARRLRPFHAAPGR